MNGDQDTSLNRSPSKDLFFIKLRPKQVAFLMSQLPLKYSLQKVPAKEAIGMNGLSNLPSYYSTARTLKDAVVPKGKNQRSEEGKEYGKV